jgi:hypothetical protein
VSRRSIPNTRRLATTLSISRIPMASSTRSCTAIRQERRLEASKWSRRANCLIR